MTPINRLRGVAITRFRGACTDQLSCVRGLYSRCLLSENELASRHRNVLLLLRGDLRAARKAFVTLKAKGCVVAIAFKEAGTHQVAQQLSHPKTFSYFGELASNADLCLSSTPDLVPLFSVFPASRLLADTVSNRLPRLESGYPNFRAGRYFFGLGVFGAIAQSSAGTGRGTD